MENEKDEMIEEIEHNMDYLEKSNKLIDKVRRYYDIINEVENVEMESEENA